MFGNVIRYLVNTKNIKGLTVMTEKMTIMKAHKYWKGNMEFVVATTFAKHLGRKFFG